MKKAADKIPGTLSPGDYVEKHGPLLSWPELKTGMPVILDVSTQSHIWLKYTVIIEFARWEEDGRFHERVILDDGKKSHPLINREYIDRGQTRLYKVEEEGEAMLSKKAESTPSSPSSRPLSAITEEIQFYKAQAGQCIVEIGKRLLEAKEQLPHGQWEAWLEKSVEFTPRTAQRFMKIASEYDSKTTPVSFLPYTKLLALLQLPPEEREEFIAEPHTVNGREKTVDEMTKRELQAAIREKNEAVKARKEAEWELSKERIRAEQAEKEKEGLVYSLRASRDTAETLRKNIDAKENALTSLREEVDRLRARPYQKPEIPESEKEALRLEGARVANEANRRQLEALREELEEERAAKLEPVPEDEAVEAAFRFNQTVQAAADQLRTFFRLVPVAVAAREFRQCAEQLERQRDELYTMAQRAANLALTDADDELPPMEDDDET